MSSLYRGICRIYLIIVITSLCLEKKYVNVCSYFTLFSKIPFNIIYIIILGPVLQVSVSMSAAVANV